MFFFDHARRKELFPKSLEGRRGAGLQIGIFSYLELPEKERLQTDVPPVWKYSLAPDVLEALRELSYGKCPFCESANVTLRPYRFRPPAHATPRTDGDDKSSYLWLAFNWENLFPICDDCLPVDKSYFPVDGERARFDPEDIQGATTFPILEFEINENSLLYHPGVWRNPNWKCAFDLDGNFLSYNDLAHHTIQHFKLNRPELVRQRAAAIQFQVSALRDRRVFDESSDSAIHSFERLPFGGARYVFLRELAKVSEPRPSAPRDVSPIGIVKFFERQFALKDYEKVLERALNYYDETSSPEPPMLVPQPIPAAKRPKTEPGSTSYDLDHPRLTHIKISNFKSLEKIEFALPEKLTDEQREAALQEDESSEVPDAPAVMILGENSTGKSSILEAIALTCMPAEQRGKLKLKASRLTTNPEYMGAEMAAENRQARVRNQRKGRVELTFSDKRRFGLNIGKTIRPSGQKGWEERPYLFAYGAHRLYGKVHRDDEMRHVDTLFGDDKQISNPERWLAQLSKARPEALNEVVSALRHIIQIDGYFEHIEVHHDPDEGRDICLIKFVKTRKNGEKYELFQKLDIASSGYKAVLAVVCDILEKLMSDPSVDPYAARKANAIVLIDEIEAHLHPRWKLQIVSGLRRALPGATFILTSHDPLCVRGMYGDEVMMLNRYQNDGSDADDGLPEVVERVAEFGNIGTMTVEQLLTSDLFQLLSTDDRKTEQTFARASDILVRENRGEVLSPPDRETLERFRTEIGKALPYGRTEVPRLVQEAVAEYLAERRDRGKAETGDKRKEAKKRIKNFLMELLE